jgi:16S rRNA (guanine527-N7)-methyltransferase
VDAAAREREREFRDALRKGAELLGLSLPEAGVDRLVAHWGKLVLWAGKTNLTALRGPAEMAEGLYLDSAMMLPRLEAGRRLHDVGTGGGFPGLVLKGLLPEMAVVLSEARQKKVAFLRQAAREMGVSAGLEIRCETVGEGRAPDPLADEVVSKAAFPPEEWMRMGPALVRPGGRLWFFTSERLSLPLPAGWVEEVQIEYVWPFSGRNKFLCALRARG